MVAKIPRRSFRASSKKWENMYTINLAECISINQHRNKSINKIASQKIQN